MSAAAVMTALTYYLVRTAQGFAGAAAAVIIKRLYAICSTVKISLKLSLLPWWWRFLLAGFVENVGCWHCGLDGPNILGSWLAFAVISVLLVVIKIQFCLSSKLSQYAFKTTIRGKLRSFLVKANGYGVDFLPGAFCSLGCLRYCFTRLFCTLISAVIVPTFCGACCWILLRWLGWQYQWSLLRRSVLRTILRAALVIQLLAGLGLLVGGRWTLVSGMHRLWSPLAGTILLLSAVTLWMLPVVISNMAGTASSLAETLNLVLVLSLGLSLRCCWSDGSHWVYGSYVGWLRVQSMALLWPDIRKEGIMSKYSIEIRS